MNFNVVNREWNGPSRAVLLCLTGLVVAMSASTALGTALTWGVDEDGDPVTPLRWPHGSVINVFIETDPDNNPPDRSELSREGIARWTAVLAARGITLSVTVGAPPDPPPAGAIVRCDWEPAGTQLAGLTLGHGAGQATAIGVCEGEGANLTGGEINLLDSLPANGDDQKEMIRNVAQHELTHVLGLADDDDGEVTNHDQDDTANTFNATDTAEINTLYPLPQQQAPQGQGQTEPNVDPNQFNFNFFYNGEPNDHIASIVLDIEPDLIANLIPPPGWVPFNPADPARFDPEYPFYQGHMEDGAPGRPLWDPAYRAPVAFRALNEASTLSASNPVVSFEIQTQGAERGQIAVWAGGDGPQILEGPVPGPPPLPAAGPWALTILAAILIAAAVIVIRRPAAA